MKRKISFVLLTILLASCSPTKRLARLLERYPLDTTSTTTVEYRDSIIEIKIPGDTVYSEKNVPIPYLDTDSIAKLWRLNGRQRDLIDDLNKQLASARNVEPIYNETDFARSKAWIEDGILKNELQQKDSVLQDTIENAIKESTTIESIPYPVLSGVKAFWRTVAITVTGIFLIVMLLLFLFRKR